MADRIRDAWADLLAAECSAHPVVLVLEDLHWGDLPSMKLVQFALSQLRDIPLTVLGLARPEVHDVFPKLWLGHSLQETRLGELSRRAAESLVRSALGSTVDAQQVAEIVDRGAGNAFYLEELVRAAAQGRGNASPETVLAMVEGRLSALDLDARRMLRAASIFGDVFWQGGVVALLGGAMASSSSEQLLSVLKDREIIVRRPQSRLPGESEYSFRGTLLRESAYAMLTEGDRKLGHKLAAEWLVRAGEKDPARLAEHLERGGELARAAAVLRRGERQG
jgi:predicted ATPase